MSISRGEARVLSKYWSTEVGHVGGGKSLTSHQILVQSIHRPHVCILDVEATNTRILDNPILFHALG